MLNTDACGLLLQTKWRGPINMSVNLGRMTGVYTSGRGEYPGGMPGAGNVRAGMSSGRREMSKGNVRGWEGNCPNPA